MRWTLALCVLLAVACGDGGEARTRGDRPAPSPSASFERATALIDTGGEPVLLDVEIAQTPEQKALGLMHRRSLDPNSGMVFVYFEKQRGGFWMKNTRIPLSIAFFGVDGKILRILDMEPCRRDPCPVYSPGVAYMGALEVNRGAFERWGVEEGDVIRVTQ